jgi:hypothetical protein
LATTATAAFVSEWQEITYLNLTIFNHFHEVAPRPI